MSLKDGHYKTKRKDGTRSCFYCRRDVTKWQALSWDHIRRLYEYEGLKYPTALCCDECFKKPDKELHDIFWQVVVAEECAKYKQGKPSVIKDQSTYDLLFAKLRGSNAVEEAQKFLDAHK